MKAATAALAAESQGKFWEVSDLLFKFGKQGTAFSTKTLQDHTLIPSGEFSAALESEDYLKLLNYDIRKGMKLRITSTPTFVIDDTTYVGTIPIDIIEKILH